MYQNPPPPDKTVVVVVEAWVVGGAVVVVTRVVVGGAVVAVVRVVLVVAVDDGDRVVDGAIEVTDWEGVAVVADVPPLAGDDVDDDA